MDSSILQATAKAMVAPGKGLLAADESTRTSEKRFAGMGIEHTEENRRVFRQMLVTAPGIEEYLSGVILYDETFHQKIDDGKTFPEYLSEKGIVPGIKVDAGAKDLALHEGEMVTEGLDGLRERFAEYRKKGAGFAKWRAVITIGDGVPSGACMKANAHALARYAALAQENDIVPVVEPEVLLAGDHSLQKCFDVSEQMLMLLFDELVDQDVDLEAVILKASMVLSGKDASNRAEVQEVAERTVECLLKTVPEELPGIVFLSGGQGSEEATAHLNAMNKLEVERPWPLTFSYSRAIQEPVMDYWGKNEGDVEGAHKVLLERCKANSQAALGSFGSDPRTPVV
jgi:fructose-bisphosphate aldolase, class I